MTSRQIRVLVPPPVPVPRLAVWLSLLLDRLQAARSKRAASTTARGAAAAQRYAAEGGK